MTKICTIHVDDEVHCRIGGLRPEHVEVLFNKFGVFVDGYFHMPAYQLRRWDGKAHFFDKAGKTFTKLLDEIVPYLCTWDYQVNFLDKRLPAPVIVDRIDENFFNVENFNLRPYQVDVVNALLEEGSGFAVCATGAGKTSMCAALGMVLYLNGLQTLIIVPSTDLVTQTVEELQEKLTSYPITIGEYSGSHKDIDHPIVVATWQSLQNVPHYMSFFQAVVVDECFSPDTSVLTPNGYVRIIDLEAGDSVISYNEDHAIFEKDTVIKIHKNLSKSSHVKMYELEFEDEKIVKVTGNHKFLTSRGYVRADELTFDDEIINTKDHGYKANDI
jgi:hypothetical protein